MKKTFTACRFLTIMIVIFVSGFAMAVKAQSVMSIPSHGNIYTGNSRGFWFTAPVDFVITGIRAPIEINTNAQSIHLVKFTAPPPIYSLVTTSFTTLHYSTGIAGTNFVSMNIPVDSGDYIGVMAVRNNGSGNGQTSYATPVGPYVSYIGTYPLTLTRIGWQGNIINSPALDFWEEPGAAIGRAEIQYVLSQPTDAGLESFVNISDSICSGTNPVTISLKNYGPNLLSSAKINWTVNNIQQAAFNWSGSLSVNASANVNIGSYSFATGVTYDLLAWVSDANNDIDSFPGNDTIHKTGITVNPSPGFTLNDTVIVICQGDSAQITGQLLGSPPWNINLHDGTSATQFPNITQPGFGLWVSPLSTKTYSITQITDATGCVNNDTQSVVVSAVPQPPAAITPVGSTAACMGDSVTLMASIGLNFIYEWLKDGIIIPGVSSYVLSVKQSGAYTVKVTSPAGCSTTSAPFSVVIHPLPAVFLGNDTNLLPGANIMLDAGAGFNSHNWSTGATSRTIMVDTTGHGMGVQTIWVEVKDNNYCSGHDTIKINFTKNPGIEEAFSDAAVRIIPNPTDGEFELHLERFPAGNITVQLFGPDGKLSYTKDFMLRHATEQISVDPGQVSDGLYLLKISNDQGSLVRKVVIRK